MTSPDIRIDTDRPSRLKLAEQIDVLTMRRPERRKLIRGVLSDIRDKARANAREHKTVTGEKFVPRSKQTEKKWKLAGKPKRKMLMKIARSLSLIVRGDYRGVVTYRNGTTAKIAYAHQHGMVATHSAKRNRPPWAKKDKSKEPATIAQAKALNRNGYRHPEARTRGKGGAVLKKKPIRWFLEKNDKDKPHMTFDQAALILHKLKHGNKKKPSTWKVKLPARPFLGCTPAESEFYLTEMAQATLANIRNK
jgi:phage virion morphogenesis protein